MNKSIYDEALQELKDATTDLKDLEIIHSYDVRKIETALKQAQKQEKLLELYKEKSEILSLLKTVSQYYMNKDDEIMKKIKELEK